MALVKGVRLSVAHHLCRFSSAATTLGKFSVCRELRTASALGGDEDLSGFRGREVTSRSGLRPDEQPGGEKESRSKAHVV